MTTLATYQAKTDRFNEPGTPETESTICCSTHAIQRLSAAVSSVESKAI